MAFYKLIKKTKYETKFYITKYNSSNYNIDY